MKKIPEILFEEIPGKEGSLGVITLTRQQALNALNHAMFIALNEQLAEWDKASNIKAVVIRAAEGRAFCAGGDIRHAYQLKLANDPTLPLFFRDEYRMNKRIFHFSKPYIALLDGITMGGGAGISMHGSQRVATEKLLFSMPETGIGFYPDIGATYFLSRLPHNMGIYLGLTGARIGADDCAALGLVAPIVRHEDIDKIIESLIQSSIPTKNAVTDILAPFALPAKKSQLLEHQEEISVCFSKDTVEEIVSELENHSSEWCKQMADILKTKSPTSLKVTLYAMKIAVGLSFDECMRMEYRLTSRFVQGYDFFEGVRAAIIDKDQSPKWMPAHLSDVSLEQVKKYFAPLEKELV